MKYLIILSIAFGSIFTSCMTMGGVKKQLFLVDAPKDLKVNYKGQPVALTKGTLITRTPTQGGRTTVTGGGTYPAVKIKLTKDTTVLELVMGDTKIPVKIKTKRRIGFLILDGILTLGISPAIDIATKAHIYTNDYLIDVPAALNGSKPRSRKDLWGVIGESQK
jgi:hypothetical protein